MSYGDIYRPSCNKTVTFWLFHLLWRANIMSELEFEDEAASGEFSEGKY